MSASTTPGRQQYLDIKAQYPDAIVWFRLGDFYEMFDEDAKIAASALRITLTSRSFGKDCRVPMCGVPHHAHMRFLARLVKQGYKVAICEQMTPAGARLVERQVVRVVTAGTISDIEILPSGENNYLIAVSSLAGEFGLAHVDVSTGEFLVTGALDEAELRSEVERLAAAECLVQPGNAIDLRTLAPHIVAGDASLWDTAACARRLKDHLQVRALHISGCEGRPALLLAAGAILGYLERTHGGLLKALRPLQPYTIGPAVALDEKTRSALLGPRRGPDQAGHSLRHFLTRTRTTMGTRLLARWLARPTQDLALLGARQDAIAYLAAGQDSRAALRAQLGGVGDIERLTTRCAQERATPQELLALATALETLPALCSLVPDSAPVLISALRLALDPAPDIAAGIRAAVAEQGSGRIIQRGFDPDLDSMLSRIDEAREKLAQLETLERERTGIRSLKVAFNQVFGYYLEVTQANLSRVPAHYVRKQTLAHAERYVCPELTQWEARLREAESAADDLERACYSRVLQRIGANAPRLLQTGAAVARLDVLCNLAEVAATERFVRPILLKEPELSILGGRHPLVEAAVGRGAFIPNDCVLGGTEATLAIVTGPNMGGKSTYLRQVALIVYLAHIGSFVPAAAARIGTVDRIFARIGAHDDLEGGQSTFLVEMGETAAITRQATAHSLILLDEIGRGTTSVDGQAIAQAVAEYLHDHAGARTLFATHYYDLARAAAQWPRACNLHVQAEEQEGAVVFLYTVDQGIASKSYALHVAQMAGMPEQITMRAQELMESVQEGQASMAPDKQAHQHLDPPARLASRPLLRLAEQPAPYAGVIDTLLQFTIASMTPIEALNALFALQQQARRLEAEPEAGMHHPTEKTAW